MIFSVYIMIQSEFSDIYNYSILLHLRQDADAAFVQMRFGDVGGAIVRREFFLRQTPRGIQHAVEGVEAMAGKLRPGK